jgi:hypothetical protein
MEPIFLSHSLKDAASAHRLAKKLKRIDQEVWICSEGIKAGENLPACINGALKKSRVFILLWSKNAKRSKWVEREWSAALMRRKRIITCRLDQSILPDLLQVDSYIDFRDFRKGCSKLIKSLT